MEEIVDEEWVEIKVVVVGVALCFFLLIFAMDEFTGWQSMADVDTL